VYAFTIVCLGQIAASIRKCRFSEGISILGIRKVGREKIGMRISGGVSRHPRANADDVLSLENAICSIRTLESK
jgi:hypothetical protein